MTSICYPVSAPYTSDGLTIVLYTFHVKITGRCVQDSGKTGTDVWGRDMGIEEDTGKEIGGGKDANDTMDVWSYKAWHGKKLNNRGGTT